MRRSLHAPPGVKEPVARRCHFPCDSFTEIFYPGTQGKSIAGRRGGGGQTNPRFLDSTSAWSGFGRTEQSGSPGWFPTPGPHRSRRAQLTHLALQAMTSLRNPKVTHPEALSVLVVLRWFQGSVS